MHSMNIGSVIVCFSVCIFLQYINGGEFLIISVKVDLILPYRYRTFWFFMT